MKRNAFLCLLVLFGSLFPAEVCGQRRPSSGAIAKSPPNIVLILADDLGYGDLACYGSQKNLTPHIDQLARSGVRFTDFHSASAVCSPTRASILTGRAPARFGITRAFRDTKEEFLPREAITLPTLLKEAGYVTAHVGKWHLGGLHKSDVADRKANRNAGAPGPLQHGFDRYLSMNEEPEPRGRLVGARNLYNQGGQHLFRDDKAVAPSSDHLTEVETAEAESLIESFHRQRKPFFLNVWFDAPHAPYEPAIDPYLKLHEGKATGDDLLYRSMVTHLDASVGRIVAKLRQLGIDGNTLLIFISDNGATGPGSSAPLRAGKGTLFEGGIRVPAIAAWPGRIRAGAISNEFAVSADLLPTICEAAGVKPPRALLLDGQSLLTHLKNGRRIVDRGPSFWLMDEYPNFQQFHREPPPYATEAVRWGRWKLLARDGKPLALYYLDTDLREQRNVMDTEAHVRDQLMRELWAWMSTTKMWSK